jgi:aquaporin TIP
MERNLLRAYLVELIGVFVLVFFAAGSVCVNHMTTPPGQQPGTASLNGHQPGLVGMALAQGLILALMLAATLPVSGGYLNPAITIMLWVFNRLDTIKAVWLLGAQFLGAVLAGLCLKHSFDVEVLASARLGTPHLNPLVYTTIDRGALLAGTGMELILTFSLVLAIFSVTLEGFRSRSAAWAAGAAMVAAVIIGFPLTGAALNPARWFGPVLWELSLENASAGRGPMADIFVYLAGPILGALLAGLVSFKMLRPEQTPVAEPVTTDGSRAGATHVKVKK